jgi:hypothetical protein
MSGLGRGGSVTLPAGMIAAASPASPTGPTGRFAQCRAHRANNPSTAPKQPHTRKRPVTAKAVPQSLLHAASANTQSLSGLIWSVADLLRDNYRQHEYGKVILPFTALRSLDGVHLNWKER